MLCTALTVRIAFIDLGPFNTRRRAHHRRLQGHARRAVLHAREATARGSPGPWCVGSVFWLGILLALTMGDYLTRPWRTRLTLG